VIGKRQKLGEFIDDGKTSSKLHFFENKTRKQTNKEERTMSEDKGSAKQVHK
jgi:hypothetical protein